ncbi:MAG: hypothetical protein HC913_05205 [Microscillaceae bacterium]|nr:hypothetical protein [Microscillaceae bacterium]
MEAALEAAQSQTWPDDRPPSPLVGVQADTSRQTNASPVVGDSTRARSDSAQTLPGDTVQTRPVSDSLELSPDRQAKPLPADSSQRLNQADSLSELASLSTEDSLLMAKNKKLKEIRVESGKQAQTNTEADYPPPMSDWKKQEQALMKEKEALSEALSQNPDQPEASAQRDRIIEIDNQLKILLNDMRIWLESQKKILSP